MLIQFYRNIVGSALLAEVVFFLSIFLTAFLGGHSTAQAPLVPGDIKEYSESVATNHAAIDYRALTTWVCRYNVGPNNDLKKPGVKKACLAYAKAVARNMVETSKALQQSK
jgi:hypothetical protein